MKQFDEWWEEHWTEQEWAGCKKCTEKAFDEGHQQGFKEGFNEGMQAGMLEAAEIAFPNGSVIGDYDEYNAGRNQAAEEIRDRFAGLTDDHCQDGHTVFCGVSGTIRDESE